MVEEHKIKTTYETELSQEKPGEWSSIVMELTSPKDPVWEMVEYRLKCAYCGMKTRESIRDVDVDSTLRDHAKNCSKNPCRELEEEIKVLKKMLEKYGPQIQGELMSKGADTVIDRKKKSSKSPKPSKKVRRKTCVPVLRKGKK